MSTELKPAEEVKVAPTKPTDSTTTSPSDKPYDALDAFRLGTKPSDTEILPSITANNTDTAKGPDGFEILGAPEAKAKPGDSTGGKPEANKPGQAKIETLPSLKEPFDAEKIADSIEKACNGGWTFGVGTDVNGVLNALKGLSPEQVKAVDEKFATKHGVNYGEEGKRWGLAEEFKDELGEADLKIANDILNAKNEIPPESRAAGAETLKDGAGLKVGETNRVTMEDGRKYDVYVPANAQKPLPVVMVMHGASKDQDMSELRIMEKETGMNNLAEQYGFAVVYAYNEPQPVTGLMGVEQNPSTWNLHGRKNFLPTNEKYDDAKYLDRVVDDVGARVNVDESRVGLVGMSDGGRAAEQYALDRPGKFNALSVMHGTWMQGERRPEAGTGLPTMITHGTSDKMLPFEQGKDGWLGEKGRGLMSWVSSSFIPGTSESRPHQQIDVMKDANACEGEPTKTTVGDVETTHYKAEQCKTGEIKQFLVKGNNHAWQDWQNEGGWYFVGMPNRQMQMSEETAKFILRNPIKRNF